MRMRQLALALATAGYVAGASAGVLDWLFDQKPDTTATAPANWHQGKVDAKAVEADKKRQEKQLASLQERGGSTDVLGRANVHRQDSAARVPFVREQGLSGEQTYIVQLSDAPVTTYRGGIKGLDAVSAQPGKKVSLKSAAAKAYVAYLSQKQGEAVGNIRAQVKGDATPFHYYRNAFNGMAMRLTQDQAQAVAELPGVRGVTRSTWFKLNTDVGPEHIGATSMWDGSAGGVSGAVQGEGLIAGIIDTGINSDHPSFAAVGGDGYAHVNPYGSGVYKGDCAKPEFAFMCNDKLIGVRSYPEITNAYNDWDLIDPNTWGPRRPATGEDYNGHGSHTASTVAGNILYNQPLITPVYGEVNDGFAINHTFARVSGVAPHANIIAYQVCHYGGQGDKYAGCPETATLKAIDDAIADGVDILNYSIGGGEGFPWQRPTELAFLNAREAGISVAAAAGNSGTAGRDHSSPWLAAVAATTHPREIFIDQKTVGNFSGGTQPPGWDISGYSLSGGITANVVAAANFDNPNSFNDDDLCDEPYPPGTFNGEIVVCRRGVIARVTKGANVLAGGAGGMILYDDPNDFDAPPVYSVGHDPHVLPAIHIGSYYGDMIINWLSSGSGHMATISDLALSVTHDDSRADKVADFSSRGPSATVKDVMFPSIGAPGVDIYAAYADEHPFNQSSSGDFITMSGTSMASPHVAGTMLLMRQAHPDWDASEIQSALMMTASPAYQGGWGGPKPASFFDAGTGVVRVNQAANASLVLKETVENFRVADPTQGGNVSALNMPYLVNRDCRNDCSWMRTFRATRDGSWTVSVEDKTAEGASMLRVTASPSTFSLNAGETQVVLFRAQTDDVTVTGGATPTTSAVEDRFAAVHVDANDGSPRMSLPVIVRWGSAGLPIEINADTHRSKGRSIAMPKLLPEYSQLNARVFGLKKGTMMVSGLSSNQEYLEYGGDALAADPGRKIQLVDIPAGTKRFVVDVNPAEPGSKALPVLDMGRDVNEDGKVDWFSEAICYSLWNLRNFCAINNPQPGKYWIMVSNEKFVDIWSGEVDTVDSVHWSYAVIGENDNKNMEVIAPSSNDGRQAVDLGVKWNLPAIQEGEVYYGAFDLGSDARNPGNLGQVAVRVEHTGPDLDVSASKQAARVGDVVNYRMQLDPNLFGVDRNYNIDVNLPAGLKVMPGSVVVKGNGGHNSVSTGDQSISISGEQRASNAEGRRYSYTTSDNDPLCRIPGSENGKYLDLRNFGYFPMPEVEGRSNQLYQFETASFWGADVHVPIYGVKPEHSSSYMGISPGGFVQYDDMPMFYPFHYPMLGDYFPDIIVAPYWRGNTAIPTADWDSGVIAARDREAGLQYYQWLDVKQINGFFEAGDPQASYNFETVISENLNFGEGEYELYFAYDNMTGNYNTGSVGAHGYYGPRGTFGPDLGYLGDSYGFDDLRDKIRNGLVVCGEYHGPEQSTISVQFAAKVGAIAVGTDLNVSVTSAYEDAETVSVVKTLKVTGNIVVADLADVSIAQNTTAEDISVMYVDRLATANTIAVTGAHVKAVISGNNAGATFDLIPDTDWYGETDVTVTVYDSSYPTDRHSQSFKLTVHPVATAIVSVPSRTIQEGMNASLDGGESWAANGRTLTYNWTQISGTTVSLPNADQAIVNLLNMPVGSYRFRLTVNDGLSSDSAEATITVTANSTDNGNSGGGGGGGSWPFATLLLLLLVKRRK